MKIDERIEEAIAAAFSGIWVNSYEHKEALIDIKKVCDRHGWIVGVWDAENGLNMPKAELNVASKAPADALAAVKSLRPASGKSGQRVVLVMKNLHMVVLGQEKRAGNIAVVQLLHHFIEEGQSHGLHVIVLGCPGLPVPLELEKMFLVLDHDLPDTDELRDVMANTAEEKEMPEKDSQEEKLLLDAAAGLTRFEAAGAFGISLVRHKELRPETMWEIKESTLKKSGLLSMLRPTAGFARLGGLNHVKDFMLRAINSPNRSEKVSARGVNLVGVPGSGKSEIAKALAFEVKLPCIQLNAGELMGGVVGSTEANTARAFKMINAMKPCVVLVD